MRNLSAPDLDGFSPRSHGVYLDNQASSPIDPRVIEAMVPFLEAGFGNPHSAGHGFGWQAERAVDEARDAVASAIGAAANEIVFTSGATEANNMALLGAARGAPKGRSRIVVTAIEHACVLAAAHALRAEGFEVVEAPVTSEGIVDLQALAGIVDDATLIVSVMAVNNEVGSEQPLSEVAALCRKHGALFHSDAAQALMVSRPDVDRLGVDLLSLSAHKAHGPKGIGGLYVRSEVRGRIRPIMFGGDQEDGLRPGTVPTFLCVGFATACSIAVREGEADATRIRSLRDRLLARLRAVEPDLVLNGPLHNRHAGNLNVRVSGLDADLILAVTGSRLAASTGSACTSRMPGPSHVLLAMGLDARSAGESIRLSLGRFNTDDDIDRAATVLADAYAEIRSGR